MTKAGSFEYIQNVRYCVACGVLNSKWTSTKILKTVQTMWSLFQCFCYSLMTIWRLSEVTAGFAWTFAKCRKLPQWRQIFLQACCYAQVRTDFSRHGCFAAHDHAKIMSRGINASPGISAISVLYFLKTEIKEDATSSSIAWWTNHKICLAGNS